MAKIRDGVDVGWQNFENLLGIGLDLGCIFQVGWTWGGRGGQRGGLGHPVSHPVHPGHPIGDIYNTNSPFFFQLSFPPPPSPTPFSRQISGVPRLFLRWIEENRPGLAVGLVHAKLIQALGFCPVFSRLVS